MNETRPTLGELLAQARCKLEDAKYLSRDAWENLGPGPTFHRAAEQVMAREDMVEKLEKLLGE